jgi:Tol biopolymer transport system component
MRTASLAAALAVAAITAPGAGAASRDGSASALGARTDAGASRARSCAHADRPIVFAHSRRSGGHSAIIAVDLRGRCPRNLTGYSSYVPSPDWSPGGRLITFAKLGAIWVMRADGTGARRLTALGNPHGLVAGWPAWSPNGRWIAYHTFDLSPVRLGDTIHLIHPDGTGERTITPEYDPATGATWAPDSKHIAYTASDLWPDEWGPTSGIYPLGSPFLSRLHIIRIDGTGDHIILPRNQSVDFVQHAPAWSAQNRIAFITEGYASLYLFSVTPQGTQKHKLVKAISRGGWTWSPDGRYLMYGRTTGPQSYTFAIADTRTGKVRTLPTYGDDPSWRRTSAARAAARASSAG